MKSDLRLAQVGQPAKCFQDVRAFSRERWIELESFQPHVLAGSSTDLLELARLIRSGEIDLASVDCALFVITRSGNPLLGDVSRVVLWQAFGVPVYEILSELDGTAVAFECEAQDGWHLEASASVSRSGELVATARARKARPTAFFGQLNTAACACGRPGMRIMNVESRTAHATQLAAIA